MHLAVAVLAALPGPVDLDRLSIAHARQLAGRPVVATFLVAKPAYSDLGVTTLGAFDQQDGSERGAVLRGIRRDVDEGERVTVVGVLRVTDWPTAFVGGVLVPAWVGIEVRGR